MNPQPPIPEPFWSTVPADAQAALVAAWNSLQDRITALEATVRDLQARLQLNFTNSFKPPWPRSATATRQAGSPQPLTTPPGVPGTARPNAA